MQTVALFPAFVRQAAKDGMTEAEVTAAVNQIAADPAGGDLIVGSGGCRKVRVAGKRKGKSGGYRVVTYYAGKDHPVCLFAVLAKGSRDNFTDAEVNAMARMAAAVEAERRARRRMTKED